MEIKKILWIEEEADDVLIEFNTYFSLNGYILDVVYSSSEAEVKLNEDTYNLIILDIRIIPGDAEKWVDLHINGEKRLGLVLLKDVISKNVELLEKVMIFTNENFIDIKEILSECGITESKFLRKRDAKIPEQLERFIKEHF